MNIELSFLVGQGINLRQGKACELKEEVSQNKVNILEVTLAITAGRERKKGGEEQIH